MGNSKEFVRAAMKRNLIPLLGIAFVVAIISTGIFYGLFVGKLNSEPGSGTVVATRALKEGATIARSDVQLVPGREAPKGACTSPDQAIGQTVVEEIGKGQPVLTSKLAARSGGGIGVPDGMRAVSIHVTDSSGVLALLRPGHKVDVQVFRAGSGNAEVRTVLQDLTVLDVRGQPDGSSQGGFSAPVVTVLATPHDADLLGVADSYARIRLLLRNPLDEAQTHRSTLDLAELFRGTANRHVMVPHIELGYTRPAAEQRFTVEVLGVSPAGFAQIAGRFGLTKDDDVFQAAVLAAPKDVNVAIQSLVNRDEAQVLASSNVEAGLERPGTVAVAASRTLGMRIRLVPYTAQGRPRLRIEPEIASPSPTGLIVRRAAAEVAWTGGQTLLLAGVADPRESDWLFSRLAPDHAWKSSERQLIVLVRRKGAAALAEAVDKH
jgi:Flp pilus assembly protein CpaB